MLLISGYLRMSTCLIMIHKPTFKFHLHCSNHQYHRQEHLHPVSKNRNRFLSENNQKYTKRSGFYWSTCSSIRGLFEVLEEEVCNDFDQDDDHGIDSSQSRLLGINDIEKEEENINKVSDAEALLACWSFLKRRKRLGGWNEYEERQTQNALSQNFFLTDEELGDIILDEDDDDDGDDGEDKREAIEKLEDPDNAFNFEKLYDDDGTGSITTVQDILSGSSPVNDKHRFDDESYDDDDVAKDHITISSFISDTDSPIATEDIGINNSESKDIDLWYTEFTSFPTEPSHSRTRRVDAMKRRWEDPAYRERWHEKRWGSKSNHQGKKYTQQTGRERQAIQRARDLPSGFLGSDELASMTEEEIANAITTRIRSTRKRIARRKETLQGRKDVLAAQIKALESLSEDIDDNYFHKDEDTLPREVRFSPTKKTLEKARQTRSERAKNLYATRLRNQNRDKEDPQTESSLLASSSFSKNKAPTRKKGPYYPPKQQTPQDAFLRIENDLDNGISPTINDVRLVLEPGRMKNRKSLLRRILQDGFSLRGKCVPYFPNTDDATEDDYDELEFVTHCTIERLGIFIISLLKNDDDSS